jgi:CPA1 family monovalent cation:H+ antiporter
LIETLAVIIVIILLSRLVEEKTTIPINLPLIALSYIISSSIPGFFHVTPETFDEILIMLLPVILFPDVINLSIKEVKENFLPIFYLAFLGVAISLAIAVWIAPYFLNLDIPVGAWACLFAPLMATDAITVTSMAGKFNLPERLKVVAEGESLFNDATALILFFFIALPLLKEGHVEPVKISITLVEVFVFSTLIGITVSLIGFYFMKFLRDPIEQFFIAYLVAISAFIIAEHFHLSGIFAILISLMLFRVLIDKEVKKGMIINYELEAELNKLRKENKSGNVLRRVIEDIKNFILNSPALSNISFRTYRKEAIYVGLFANAVLFILMAELINLDKLLHYWKEILIVFGLSTVLRYLLVSGLRFVSGYPFRWINAITFAGMKGGLTLIMIHSIPDEYPFKEMLVTIVLGVVMLSIFIYTFILLFYIAKNKKQFEFDMLKEETCVPETVLEKELEEIIEKDPNTGIYNIVKFKDLLNAEIKRATIYKTPLTLIIIEFVNYEEIKEKLGSGKINDLLVSLKEIISSDVTVVDIMGRIAENRAAIISINKSIEDDLKIIEKINKDLIKFEDEVKMNIKLCFGIASYVEGDSSDILLEKAVEAIERAKKRNCEIVGIAI